MQFTQLWLIFKNNVSQVVVSTHNWKPWMYKTTTFRGFHKKKYFVSQYHLASWRYFIDGEWERLSKGGAVGWGVGYQKLKALNGAGACISISGKRLLTWQPLFLVFKVRIAMIKLFSPEERARTTKARWRTQRLVVLNPFILTSF